MPFPMAHALHAELHAIWCDGRPGAEGMDSALIEGRNIGKVYGTATGWWR